MRAVLHGRVLVAGGGVSGRGCAKILAGLGVDTTVADGNRAVREDLAAQFGVATVDPETVNVTEFDVVVTSPGWRPDSPLLVAAASAGISVLGDVELAYQLDKAEVFGPKRQWLVVTGTNGKTTTTGMLAAIMQADAGRSGLRAQAVGNIGLSLFDALTSPERVDILVAELSSFQLHWSDMLTPDVGVLLNLADDHIDWHGSFADYARAKAKVLTGKVAVVGVDDPQVLQWWETAGTAPVVVGFTVNEPTPGQVGVVDGDIVVAHPDAARVVLASAEGLQPAGVAGVLDACAAAAAAYTAGAAPEAIAEGLRAYTVAGHRGAVVHQADGIAYVDNSKATNPHAAAAAMEGLGSFVWIAGGQLKGADVSELVRSHAGSMRAAVLLGRDRDIIAAALATYAPSVPVEVIAAAEPGPAMEAAVAAAAQHAVAGDTVLLAPAAASLDMYTGMAQRGDMFAAAARAIAPKTNPDRPHE